MEMALDDILEEEKKYTSPVDFLEKEQNRLPEDQSYWVENSTGRSETFESLERLKEYLEAVETNWSKYRDFLPVGENSDFIQYRESDEAEYMGAEFPYIVLETRFTEASAGQAGSVRFGYLAEKEDEIPERVSVSEPSDD
jgi:hypothetical protein